MPDICAAVADRKALTEAMKELTIGGGKEPADYGVDEYASDGSQDDLLKAYWTLHGIVAEYTEGGDQMAEQCTCEVKSHREDDGMTFEEVFKAYKARMFPGLYDA